MPCNNPCEAECQSQDECSPGPIAGGERLARGVYHPTSGTLSTGNVKQGFVPANDLLRSEFSVWRLGEQPRLGVPEVVETLKARQDRGELFAVLAVATSAVRQIRSGLNGGRAACVRDECTSDQEGNKHPAHAHIGLCNELRDVGLSRDSEHFIQLQQDVRKAFLSELAWASSSEAEIALKKQHPGLA